jgi:hypothetical protein
MAKKSELQTGPGLHGGPAATQILRDGHRRIVGLFDRCRQSALRAREIRECGCSDLYAEIDTHHALVEDIFYPAVLEAMGRCGPDVHPGMGLLGQVRDRDQELRKLIEEIRGLDVDSARFLEHLEELSALYSVHVDEEERELIPLAEEVMPIDEMGTLGMRLEMRRQELARRQPRRDVA